MGRNKKVIELTPQEAKYGAKINDKGKYWYVLVWEKSIRKDWKKWLEKDGIKWIALLHNEDKKENGDKIENHYHFFLDAGGTFSRSAMIRYREELNGTSLLLRKYKNRAVDYLSHKNNPKKTQYDISKYLYGNMDEKEFKKYLEIDKEEKNIQFKFIMKIIDEYQPKSIKQLLSFIDSNELGLSKEEKESLYAEIRGGDFFRIDKILASINKENKEEREREKGVRERLKEIAEEQKREKKNVLHEEEKEIIEDDYDRELTKSEVESARDELAMHGVELDTSKKYTRRDIEDLVRATINYNI